MPTRRYTMTAHNRTRLLRERDEVCCQAEGCGRIFEVGDEVVSKPSSGQYRTRLFCIQCALRLHLIP